MANFTDEIKEIVEGVVANELLPIREELGNLRTAVNQKAERGEKGEKGDSIIGPIGLIGKNGKSGRNGKDGENGIDGKNGLDGKDGKDAILALELFAEFLKESSLEIKNIQGLDEKLEELKFIAQTKKLGSSYGRIATRYISEAPVGTPNGSLKTFTLSTIAAPNSLRLFRNGQHQRPGSSNEYTLVDRTITFNSTDKPQTGDLLWAEYTKL